MSLQNSGTISFDQIKTEFNPSGTSVPLGDFYKGGTLVKNIAMNALVPTTGELSLDKFYGTARVPNPQIKLLGQITSSGTLTINQSDIGPNTHIVVASARYSGSGFGLPAAPSLTGGFSMTTIIQSYSGVNDSGHFSAVYTAKIGSSTPTLTITQTNYRLYVWQVDNIPSMTTAYASYSTAGTYATPAIGCAFAGAVNSFSGSVGDISGLSEDWAVSGDVRLGAGNTSGSSTLFAPTRSKVFTLAIFQF